MRATALNIRQERDGQMRPGGMADQQHLIHIAAQRRHHARCKLRQSSLQFGRIGPAGRGRIDVIMHQIIGKKPIVIAAKPHQDPRDHHDPKPEKAGMPQAQRRPRRIGQRHSHSRLPDQHHHWIECRDHRPFAQLHKSPQRAARDVNIGGAHHLPIGRQNVTAHGGTNKIGPKHDFEFRAC